VKFFNEYSSEICLNLNELITRSTELGVLPQILPAKPVPTKDLELCFQNFVYKAQQCFAFTPQANP
jgi:hypothetical protein